MDDGSQDQRAEADDDLGGTHTDHSSPHQAARELLSTGEQLGRYRIIEPLGTGGMGAVYRAHDPDLNRDVAIKVLHTTEPGTPPAADNEKRLLREAQAMARLSHPNIVTVYDVGTFKGRVFIAMEWIDGGTLKQWLRAEKRAWRQRLEAVLDAGQGLSEAHRAEVVHRDFKPDNVLVSRKGQVQVVDFGLARSAGEPDIQLDATGSVALISPDGDALDLQLTRTGAVLGTPAYMSPEQFHGELATARSDQFGFAVVAFEALYGIRPFVGLTANEVMSSVSQGAWIAPSAAQAEGAPRAVLDALVRGLSPIPEDRYPTMDSMLIAVSAAAAPKSSTAAPRRLPWLAAGLVLVALVTSGAAYLATRDQSPAQAPEHIATPPVEPEVPAHADDLRWPTPPIPPGPQTGPGPGAARARTLEQEIKDLVQRTVESGEAADIAPVLEHVDGDLKADIRREILIELQEAVNDDDVKAPDRNELGERIKRRVFERIERLEQERKLEFKLEIDELRRELEDPSP